MTKTYCDRCGVETDLVYNFMLMQSDEKGNRDYGDLCQKCMLTVDAFIKQKPMEFS